MLCCGDLRAKLDFANTDYFASVVKMVRYPMRICGLGILRFRLSKNIFLNLFGVGRAAFFLSEFFAAGGAFSIWRSIKHIRQLNEAYPGQFKFGDMGFHNLMVFRSAQQGRSRVKAVDFQVIFPGALREALRQRFRLMRPGNRSSIRETNRCRICLTRSRWWTIRAVIASR